MSDVRVAPDKMVAASPYLSAVGTTSRTFPLRDADDADCNRQGRTDDPSRKHDLDVDCFQAWSVVQHAGSHIDAVLRSGRIVDTVLEVDPADVSCLAPEEGQK